MVSFLQRLAMPFFVIGSSADDVTFQRRDVISTAFGRSKRSVAQDRRRAAKIRAQKRARKHGQA